LCLDAIGRAALTWSLMDLSSFPERLITAEELPRHPELEPCELVKGEIVRLGYAKVPHARLSAEIGTLLWEYANKSGLGKVAMGMVGILTQRNPDTVRAADLLFISHERWARQNPQRFLDVPPELVVEILSPDDRYGEVMEKLEEYLALGVDLVWIVDPEHRCVLAYRGSLFDVERFEEGDVLADEEILPGFSLPVADIFRE
jgi:Uma2 family endonuclease